MENNVMESKNVVEIEDESADKIIIYQSAVDDSGIHVERAENLARIMKYDKDAYNDINIETVIKACEIAGIINNKKSKVKKASKKIPKWELIKTKA